MDPSESADLQPSQKIAHYQIIAKLGSGGMGEVYLALDTKLNRQIALKILSPEVSSNPDRMRRFIVEAKAAAALEHPNVASIYEIGEENGLHFIAMQYVKGETLHKRIHRVPLKMSEILSIAIQIADALQEAHSKGIIHRDIKPSNILVTSRLEPKLLDFGLAKITSSFEKGSEIATATQTEIGTVLGTLPHMSPEQIRGGSVDLRTDIFSFGTVLYEMCTGQLPFFGNTSAEIISQILQSQPPAIVRLNYDVPPELEHIVRKCLEKDPEMRYQSARDILIDLRTLHRDTHPSVPFLPVLSRAQIVVAKRLLIPTMFTLLLILATVIYYVAWPTIARKSEPVGPVVPPTGTGQNLTLPLSQNSIAVLPFKNVSPDPGQDYFCDGMTEEIMTNLSQIHNLKVIAQTTMMTYKQTNKTVRQIGRELGVNYILEGSVRKASNKVRITAQLIRAADESQLWGQDYDREFKDIFSLQDEVSSAIASKLKLNLSGGSLLRIQTVRPENLDAYEYRLKANYTVNRLYMKSRNEDDFRKAIELGLKSVRADPNYALGYCTLVYAHEIHYQWIHDPQDLKKMDIYADKAYTLNPDLVETNNAKAWTWLRMGQAESAYPYLRKALALDPNHVPQGVYAAVFSASQGLCDQAISLTSRTIEYDPLSFWAYTVRGCNYAFVGKPDEALLDFDRVKQLGIESTGLSWCHATVLLMKKRYKEADKVLTRLELGGSRDVHVREVRALYYALLGNTDKALATNRCAWVLSCLGMKDEAVSKIEEEMVPSRDHDYFRWHTYLTLISFPWFGPLHGDPQFEEIVSRQKRQYEFFSKKYKLP